MAIDLTGPRAAAEAVLFGTNADQCRVLRRPVDAVTFDAGMYDTPAPLVVYSGDCSVKAQMTTVASRLDQGAVSATQQRWSITLPIVASAADAPRPGDVIEVTESRDDALDGARYVVRDVGGGTNSVLRRVLVDRWVQGGGDDWAAPNP